MFARRISLTIQIFLAFVFTVVGSQALANIPGGGSAGPNVTLTDNGSTLVLANGIVTATIIKDSGEVSSLIYGGKELVSTSGTKTKIYHDWTGTGWNSVSNAPDPGAFETLFGCVYTVVTNSTDMIDLSFHRIYNPSANSIPADIDLHWVLRRGNTGLYCYSLLEHQPSYPPVSLGSWRMVWWIGHDAVNNVCEKIYVDDLRHWQMPSVADYNSALATGIAEIVKLTSGVRVGKYDCKYEFSASLWDLKCDGHASDVNKIGQWCVFGGHEFFNCGPTYADLNAAAGIIHITLNGLHYNTPDFFIQTGTYWKKFYGPFLLYCNTNAAGGDACWADAKAQAVAEEGAWPYAWLTGNTNYPLAGARGAMSGQFVMNDPLKPSVNSSNAWIGLADPTGSDPYTGWQFQGSNYQYWVHCDANGNFLIPNVRPGTYTLYAFNDGAMGEFSQNGVIVTFGATNALGTLTWNITHAGPFIAWEIGKPDRTAKEFKHGSTDYFEPYEWLTYANEFPNPLEFTIGASVESNDWNYAHSAYPVDWSQWKWRIKFILPTLPASGNAILNFAWASADHARIDMYLNNESSLFAQFYPSMSDGNALIREGIHAKYGRDTVSIPVSSLRVGTNTITLIQGRAFLNSITEHVMYDYLNLELPSVPPTPAGFDLEWKGGANANTWDNGTAANWMSNAVARVFNNGNRVYFDDYGDNSSPINLSGTLAPNAMTVFANKTFTLTGNGSLGGTMALNKSGAGALIVNNTNTFTGATFVTNGALIVNGSLSGSPVTVLSGGRIGGTGSLGAGLTVQTGGTLASGTSPGTLTITNGLTESGGATNLFELSDDPTGTIKSNDQISIIGNLTLSGVNILPVMPLDGQLGAGIYTLIKYTGTFSGSLANLTVTGVPGTLTNPPGAIALIVTATRFPTNIVWKGGVAANTWDNLIATNWLNDTATTYFVNGDDVTFTDPGSTSPSVNLVGDLNPNSVTVSSTNNYTFAGSGILSGAMTLTKTNSGTLTVSVTTNDYTGQTFVSGGVLSVPDLSDGGLPSSIGASSGDPTNLVVDGGSFRYMGGSVSVVRGATVGANGGKFDVSTAASGLTMSGVFAGPGQLVKVGSGTLQVGANNTYAGGTLISNGTLTISQISSLGSGAVTLAGGTLAIGQTKPTNLITVVANSTISGGSGGGLAGISKVTGSNTLNVTITTGVFDLIGDLTGFSGTILFNNSANGVRFNGTAGSSLATFNLGSGSVGAIVRNNTSAIALGGLAGTGSGTSLGGNNSFNTAITYTIGANHLDTTFAGKIINGTQASSPATIITKVGSGTLTLTGTNTYSGVTTVSGGTLQIGNGGTSGTPGTNSITDNATLAFNRSDTIDDLGFGTISGSGSLRKLGAGRLALSKTHTYSGVTRIEAGTFALTNSGSINSSSNIIISAGALFDMSGTTGVGMILGLDKTLSGFGSVNGNFRVGSRAFLAPGGGNSIGTLTFSNSLTLFTGFGALPCTNFFKISKSPATNDTVRVFGTLTNGGVLFVMNISGSALAAGDTFRLFNAASYSGSFYGFTLPPLASGLKWDTATVNTNGILKVIALPPLISAIVISGTNLIVSGSGGVTNSNYYVLTSTNLALPPAQWTRALTNQFDSSGNFSFTNAINAGAPQLFYLLQLP